MGQLGEGLPSRLDQRPPRVFESLSGLRIFGDKHDPLQLPKTAGIDQLAEARQGSGGHLARIEADPPGAQQGGTHRRGTVFVRELEGIHQTASGRLDRRR